MDTLLGVEGAPQVLWLWENRQAELDPDLREWELNPERAKQLLAEVGLEDGFEIEITASIRGVPAEEEACEAIASYFDDIGVSSKINRQPYTAVGPTLSGRRTRGVAELAGGDAAAQRVTRSAAPPSAHPRTCWHIRGVPVPAEEEACEAIASYFDDIGVSSKINRQPYTAVGPTLSGRQYVGINCHGTSGRDFPIGAGAYVSTSGWSGGFDHPVTDELFKELFAARNLEEFWEANNLISRFMFENALDSGFYSVNVLWPLGPRVDSWADELGQGAGKRLGTYEYAKHRQQ